MTRRVVPATMILGLVLSGMAWSQVNTGKITGRVTSEGNALPGVSITVTSPNLQGSRSALTTANGDYVLPQLPAGDYEMVFELDGFQTVRKAVKVSVNQVSTIDQPMKLSDVSEEIVVTGEVDTISSGTTSQTTYEKETLEQLAISRNMEQAVLLAPGVHPTGPENNGEHGAAISISGSQSYENLFLVNGVTVNENSRGQPREFIIEDAVQEHTITSSGVSAEFGRFNGGVVNVITKSGGNQFSGSFRVNVDKEAWEGRNRLSPVDQDNTQNETYEATLGGRIVKDRLWFFLAGRDLTRAGTETLDRSGFVLDKTEERERAEAKLTLSPHTSHRIIGSFMERDALTLNDHFSAIDLSTINPQVTDPEDLTSVNYNGVLTDRFFIEALWSERNFSPSEGEGGTTTERLGGTWIVDLTSFTFLASPVFCAVCVPEERNNEDKLLKASYFLSSESHGSHDIIAGFDSFNDIVVIENHQSASDFHVWSFQPFIIRGQEVFPQFTANGPNRIRWTPVLQSTMGMNFQTDSAFVNDTWRLNDKLSFNLGVRYDENDTSNGSGEIISDDSKISPRLGVTYDLKGDGNWVFTASFGDYAATINPGPNIGGRTGSAGALANFTWQYTGPDINGDPNAPTDQLVNADEALQIIFDWFDALGGINNTSVRLNTTIPGVGFQVRESITTPSSQEVTLGLIKRLGSRGLVRADYVRREFGDFYANRTDTTTGQVTNPDGSQSDLTLFVNDDSIIERKYDGLHTQFSYRVNNRFTVAGNWTWSNARGNFDGETEGNAALPTGALEYPELKAFGRNLASGHLQVDQRHRVALWGIYNPINTRRHNLSASLLQRFGSGSPFLNRGLGGPGAVDARPFVDIDSLGYVEAPPTVGYWFYARDQFITDDISSTDIALNYSFKWNIRGKEFDVFIQPEILNVFNEDAELFVDDTILDATNDSSLQPFDPFTETPVEGVHFKRGPSFGQAISAEDFQQPRTFRFSVGFRF